MAATSYIPAPTYVGKMPSRFNYDYDMRREATPSCRPAPAYFNYNEVEDGEDEYLPRIRRSNTAVPYNYDLIAEDEYEYPQWTHQSDRAGIVQSARFRTYSPPRVHMGRAGGGWRHIAQCTGQKGENILFLDGSVKVDDCRRFPPFGWNSEPRGRLLQRQRTGRRTNVNERAREGFRYWYEEPKPQKAARTIQGRQLVYGSI